MKKKLSKLSFIRLCLSGGIAGAALLGALAPVFGYDISHVKDVIGGTVGASAVAIGFKLAHWA